MPRIRPARPDDDITSLIASLAGQPYPGTLAGHTHASRLAWLNATEPVARWTVEHDTRIVGHVHVQQPGDWLTPALTPGATHLEIARLMVHPDHRREGLASRLLATAADWTRWQNAQPILCVSDYLENAIRLYEQNGWTRIADVPSLITSDRLLVYVHR